MFFMLMFLGLLPVTLAHGDDDRGVGRDAEPAAAGDTPEAPGAAETVAGGDLLDLLSDDADLAESAGDETDGAGETVTIGADSGDVSISGFQPGFDRVELRLDTDETRFESITDPDSGAPGLQISGEEDDRQILFPGLTEVPVGDIFLTREGDDGNTAVFQLREMVDSDPIFPLAGDGEDEVVPAADDGIALHPLDGDNEDTVTPGEGDPGLDPLPGDGEEVIVPAAADLDLVAVPPAPASDADAPVAPGEARAAA